MGLMRGSGRFSLLVQVSILWMPWGLRRPLLNALFGYSISKAATIGISVVLSDCLVMKAGARIGHANLVRNMASLVMGEKAQIFSRNQVTGDKSRSICDPQRRSELFLGAEAVITHHHVLDCTDAIYIGNHTILAGFASQILTHDIDVISNSLCVGPVSIGSDCYIGSGVIVLKDTVLADKCVVGAGALLRGKYLEPLTFFAGVPARKVKNLPADAVYFGNRP